MSGNKSLRKSNSSPLIRYFQFNKIEKIIQECQEESAQYGEPICLALHGATGVGKSTLAKTYTDSHPPKIVGNKTQVPVFYVTTPAPISIKGLASQMLAKLGDPAAHKGTVMNMNSRLIRLIDDCQVGLVILDDFHHLVNEKTGRVEKGVADWLKVLIKDTSTPFMITGVDHLLRQIIPSRSQLSRLFIHEHLKPFPWDVKQTETLENFAALVTFILQTLNLKLPSDVAREELMPQIHSATEGVMGNLMYLFRRATTLDKREGNNGKLTLEILSEAYDSRLADHMGKNNPFTSLKNKTPEISERPDSPHGVTKRGPKRKKRGKSISETLKT